MLEFADMKTIGPKLRIYLLMLLFPCLLWAQVDPDINWKVRVLDNYNLIYDAKHQDVADFYAQVLLENHQLYAKTFQNLPDKLTVVINDNTDLTNGYAKPIPYQLMMLFPVLPGPMESISEYGNWTRELLLHEYTHTMSFEARYNLAKPLYYALGTIVTPNILLPRWWLEGVAVDSETRYSNFGRLRSKYMDAQIRAFFLENQLYRFPIYEINETNLHTYPQGSRPYIFGSLLMSKATEYGKENQNVVSDLITRYGGRVPYFINAPIVDLTKKSYAKLYEETLDSVKSKIENQLQVLGTLSEGQNLGFESQVETFAPSISPDGLKMAVITKTDTNKRSIKILVRPNLKTPFHFSQIQNIINTKNSEDVVEKIPTKDGPPAGSINRISWFADSERFVFDKIVDNNRFSQTSELFIYNILTQKTQDLTKNLRAREPSVSPDGNQVCYVKLSAIKTQLACFGIASKVESIVYNPEFENRISYPKFLDDKNVIFSERFQGIENLKSVQLENKEVKLLTNAFENLHFVDLINDQFYFSASQNGVFNLYQGNKDWTQIKALTNSGTGILSFALDQNNGEIYATVFKSFGFEVDRFPLASAPSGDLAKIQPILADVYPVKEGSSATTETDLSAFEIKDYSSFSYLLPRYWIPTYIQDKDNTFWSITTSGSDALDKHIYSLIVAYQSLQDELMLNFGYQNNSFRPIISFNTLQTYSDNLFASTVRQKNQFNLLEANWQMVNWDTDLYWAFGFDQQKRSTPGSELNEEGPFSRIAYSNFAQSGAQISPEGGWGGTLKVVDYLKKDKYVDFIKTEFSLVKYFSKWLPKHHAVMIQAQGRYLDKAVPYLNFDQSSQIRFFADSPFPQFISRGYGSIFYGKNILNYDLEYRFPLSYSGWGFDTMPFYFKRTHAALIVDGWQSNGFYYNDADNAYYNLDPWKVHVSYGAEIKVDMSIGYQIPLTAFLGIYAIKDTNLTKNESTVIFGIIQ